MELRVLSGLHRGAAMELQEEVLSLGASEQADVMVVDPGVAPLHLRIRREGSRWLLLPADGPVHDSFGRALEEAMEVAAGSIFRMGEVWIGFFGTDDPWLDALPQRALEPQPQAPQEAAPPAAPSAPQGRWTRWATRLRLHEPGRKKMLAALGVLAAIFVPLLWMGSTPGEPGAEAGARPQAKATARNAAALAPAAASAASVPLLRASLPAAELAEALVKHLAQRSLAEKLELELTSERWDIRGSLDDDEKERLERAMRAFEKKYVVPAAVHIDIVPPAQLLPFRVMQVAGGRVPHVVLHNGQRLFVGDAVEGYRLVAVEPGKVVFAGKRRIEVAW